MTSNFAIALIQENQNNKATTANDAFKAFDGAMGGEFALAMGDADQTPAGASLWQTRVIKCTGALTANRNVTVPTTISGQTVKKEWIIRNATTGGFDVVIKTAAGASVNVAGGKVATVYMDGTDVIRVTADV